MFPYRLKRVNISASFRGEKVRRFMVIPASPSILLIGSKQVRHAPVWNALKDMQIHAYGHREFKVASHLSSDTTILLYQVTASFAQTLQFLGTVTPVQSDLCVMLFGKNIHADHVAQFLRQGAFDYLAWPCSVARLKESLIRGLANRRAFPEVRTCLANWRVPITL